MTSRQKLAIVLGAIALFAIATLLLMVFYADMLHERVWIPLIRGAYVAKHYLDHLHGLVLWLIPLGLFSIPLIRALVRVLSQQETVPRPSLDDWPIVPQAGELEELSQQLHRARRSRFARARIARNLKEISVRMIAGREGLSVEDARHLLERGYWSEHREVHALLMPRRHYADRQTEASFEHALEQALDHLEAYYKGA